MGLPSLYDYEVTRNRIGKLIWKVCETYITNTLPPIKPRHSTLFIIIYFLKYVLFGHADFIVLQVDDGTYVYAIEEVDKDDSHSSKKQIKLVPSGDVVGKLNPTEYHNQVGAERVEIKNFRNKNKNSTDTVARFARHYPGRLNDAIVDDKYFKQIGGEIPDPYIINDGNNYNHRERHLRKQKRKTSHHHELSSKISNHQYHSRESSLPTTGVIKNLVVLLQFNDHKKELRDLPHQEEIEYLMESLTSVYLENSLGKLKIESTVVPEWYTTTYNETWYAEEKSGYVVSGIMRLGNNITF